MLLAETKQDLFYFLGDFCSVLWKNWPMPMEARHLPGSSGFSLSGVCPHCSNSSAFLAISGVHGYGNHWHAAMQCQSCLKFILGEVTIPQGGYQCNYVAHYPLGKPNDNVADEIPVTIASDFKEALRCAWLDCYKAAVTMCRRAIQAACLDLGAKGRDLYHQIDDLAKNHKITEPLRQMAHAVRLEGKKAAHPPKGQRGTTQESEEPDATNDNLEGTTKEDAEAVIAFTKEFFHHVYVMPAKLKKYAPSLDEREG